MDMGARFLEELQGRPREWGLKQVAADWFEESGDGWLLSMSLRWQAEHRKTPLFCLYDPKDKRIPTWLLGGEKSIYMSSALPDWPWDDCCLPNELYDRLARPRYRPNHDSRPWKYYRSFLDACLALAAVVVPVQAR